jgi:hypothetical protein
MIYKNPSKENYKFNYFNLKLELVDYKSTKTKVFYKVILKLY